MTGPPTADLTFGRVRLVAAGRPGEAATWRRAVERSLAAVEVDAGLPPRAILVIRRLPDPRPGLLPGGEGWTDARRWGAALSGAVAEQWRHAARPWLGPVPPSAGAVWFADPAEWLACLSWDIERGVAGGRWWWQSWRRGATGGDAALFDAWRAEPRWLPPMLALLHERHGAAAVALLARLAPEQARGLTAAVAAAYRAPEGGLPRPAALPPALRAVVADLPADAAALALTCLALAGRLPAAGDGAEAAAEANAYPNAETRGSAAPQAAPAALSQARDRTDAARLAPLSASGGPAQGEPVAAEHVAARPPPSTSGETGRGAAPTPPRETGASGATPAPDGGTFTARSREGMDAADRPAAPPDADACAPGVGEPVAPSAADPLEAAAGIRTRLGGLWYLVRALEELEWPGAADLSAWRKLAALARSLIEQARPGEPVDDPVWALLAEQDATRADDDAAAQWLTDARPALAAYLAARQVTRDAFGAALADPARLFLTRTHVDVVFTLDQIRLDLRIAGLDQDPGWVPALGRVVSLHYV